MVTSYSQKSDGTVIGAAQLKLPRAVHWPRIGELRRLRLVRHLATEAHGLGCRHGETGRADARPVCLRRLNGRCFHGLWLTNRTTRKRKKHAEPGRKR